MKQPLALLLGFSALLWGCAAPQNTSLPSTAGPRQGPRTTEAAQPATSSSGGAGFDYFLLNLSWSPEFCFSHRSDPQCAAHPGFVLHGLWPENRDGTYPENCGSAPLPDPLAAGAYPDARLARHEWQAHGTCSGMDASTYFHTAQRAFQSVHIPPALQTGGAPTTMSADQIIGLFTDSNPGMPRESLALSCHNGYLSAVEVCVDKKLHAMACGAGVRSCNAARLKVTPQ